MAIDELVFFIAEHGGACGVDIGDGAVVGFFYAYEKSWFTTVAPILHHYFLL